MLLEDIMISARTRSNSSILAAAIFSLIAAAAFARDEFPYDRDLMLDTKALPGSRRVPILEIAADGRAQVDLWCKTGAARVEISDETIKFTLGPLRDAIPCTPERAHRDEELAAALAEVTHWSTEEDIVTLEGPAQTL